MCLILISKKLKDKFLSKGRNLQNPDVSDGFELKGGGVMLAQSMKTIEVNA